MNKNESSMKELQPAASACNTVAITDFFFFSHGKWSLQKQLWIMLTKWLSAHNWVCNWHCIHIQNHTTRFDTNSIIAWGGRFMYFLHTQCVTTADPCDLTKLGDKLLLNKTIHKWAVTYTWLSMSQHIPVTPVCLSGESPGKSGHQQHFVPAFSPRRIVALNSLSAFCHWMFACFVRLSAFPHTCFHVHTRKISDLTTKPNPVRAL